VIAHDRRRTGAGQEHRVSLACSQDRHQLRDGRERSTTGRPIDDPSDMVGGDFSSSMPFVGTDGLPLARLPAAMGCSRLAIAPPWRTLVPVGGSWPSILDPSL